jgi:outer membrane protein assembly factor BamC
MHRILFKLILAVILTFPIVGCGSMDFLFGDNGYFRNRSNDYQKAEETVRIDVPEGLDSSTLEDIYVIPPITEDLRASEGFEVARPAPLVATEAEQAVKIQKLAEERWVLAALAPGELWPQLRGYLNVNRIPVSRVDARQGLMETAWLEIEVGGLKERYRYRIDQGVQRNTSELHVLQMLQTDGADHVWPSVSVDDKREADMLIDMANYIANSADASSVSMIAQQAISAGGKVTLQESAEGNPQIILRLPFYRAWASLGQALKRSNFEVEDLDRSSGQYYVNFEEQVMEEEDSGWLSWMFDKKPEELLSASYLIMVKESAADDSVTIDIKSHVGEKLERAEAEKLLAVIKGNLS